MEVLSCCLLCNGVASPLIEKGCSKATALAEMFRLFCNYLDFNPSSKVERKYWGKLFPFCVSCSLNLYKLYDIHKEKQRILAQLSELVASVKGQMLENQENEGDDDPPEKTSGIRVKNLTSVVVSIRKAFMESNNNNNDQGPDPEVSPPSKKRKKAASTPPPQEPESAGRCKKVRLQPRSDLPFVLDVDLPEGGSSEGEDDPLDDPLNSDFEGDIRGLSDAEFDDTFGDLKGSFGTSENEQEDPGAPVNKLTARFKPRRKSGAPKGYGVVRGRGMLARYESSPGHYSYNGFTFTMTSDLIKCDSCTYSWVVSGGDHRTGYLILKHVDKRHVQKSGMLEVRPNEYLFEGQFPGYKAKDGTFKCGVPGCNKFATNILSRLGAHFRLVHQVGWAEAKAAEKGYNHLTLVDVQVGPGQYSYKEHKFNLRDGKLCCEFCVYTSKETGVRSMLRHIENNHIKKIGFIEMQPNELLIHGRFTVLRLTDGSYQCGDPKCDKIVASYNLTTHMFRHCHTAHRNKDDRCGPECKFDEWDDTRSKYLDLLKGTDSVSTSTEPLKETTATSSTAGETTTGFETDQPEDGNNSSEEETDPLDDPLKLDQDFEEDFRGLSDGEVDKTLDERKDPFVVENWDRPHQNAETGSDELTLSGGIGSVSREPFALFKTGPDQYSYHGFTFIRNKDGYKCGSCTYSCRFRNPSYFILNHIDKRHVDKFGMVEVRPNEYLFRNKFPGSKTPAGDYTCGVSGCHYRGAALELLWHHFRKTHEVGCRKANAAKAAGKDYNKLKLADVEMSPDLYSYKEYRFHSGAFGGTEKLCCESCLYTCSKVGFRSMLRHLETYHVKKIGFIEVHPNELLIHGKFTANRLPDGKFQCGSCDNKAFSSERALFSHCHIVHNENGKCIPDCMFERLKETKRKYDDILKGAAVSTSALPDPGTSETPPEKCWKME